MVQLMHVPSLFVKLYLKQFLNRKLLRKNTYKEVLSKNFHVAQTLIRLSFTNDIYISIDVITARPIPKDLS